MQWMRGKDNVIDAVVAGYEQRWISKKTLTRVRIDKEEEWHLGPGSDDAQNDMGTIVQLITHSIDGQSLGVYNNAELVLGYRVVS